MSDERNKKRVQFCEESDDLSTTNKIQNKLDAINELTEEFAAVTSNKLNENEIYLNDQNNTKDESFNSAQIIGLNEIYNDPRQRRLSEFNNAKLSKPVV